MCHAREREHPEYHDATRLAFAAFGGFAAYVVASSCPTAGSPLSRGRHMLALAGRDAAVVSRRRLSLGSPWEGRAAFSPIISWLRSTSGWCRCVRRCGRICRDDLADNRAWRDAPCRDATL